MATRIVFTFSLILLFSLPLVVKPQDHKVAWDKQFKMLNRSQLIDTLISISEAVAEENPDSALSIGMDALNLSMKAKDFLRQADANRRIAEAYFYRNEYQKAIDYYYRSAEANLKIEKDTSTYYGERISDAGYCYQELGLYPKARELFQLSLVIQTRVGNKLEVGTNLSNIGTSYFYQAQYDKAIDYYSHTLEMDRESGDSNSIAITLNNLGMVYSRWGKHQKALDIYEESMKYTRDENKKAIRYSNIGMAWFHLGAYDKALKYLEKALEIDVRNNQLIKIGIRKNEIGTILTAMGNHAKALRLNEEALQIFRETGIKESEIITLCDMGDIYRKTGNLIKAEACYLESTVISRQIGALDNLSRNYKGLYELNESKGDYRKAFEYYKLFSQANDSVFNIEKHEQLARFEILFETEKKEKENQLLQRDNELKQRKQRFAIAIIIGLALVVALIFYLYRSKSKNLVQNQLLLKQEQVLAKLELEKKEAENRSLEDRVFAEKQINRLQEEKHLAEIEHKNAQLANSTLCLVNKNEILGEIREKLSPMQKSDSIHEVVQFINSNTDVDQDWMKFKVSFEDVHPGFFDRLDSKFPHLTDHDIRLSSYLRINLSSREIAGLMNVSLEATNKGRQRLRKKLDLQPEADLSEFLRMV
jgi:tetratricopeptide (TPR) repeat protein